MGSDNPPTGTKRAPLLFLICITAYLLVAWADAMSISLMSDKIFPVTVGSVTLIGCLVRSAMTATWQSTACSARRYPWR